MACCPNIETTYKDVKNNVRGPEFKFCLCHLVLLWPWTSYLTTPCLNLFTYKMGVGIALLQQSPHFSLPLFHSSKWKSEEDYIGKAIIWEVLVFSKRHVVDKAPGLGSGRLIFMASGWSQTLTSCVTLGKSLHPVHLSFFIFKKSWRRIWQTTPASLLRNSPIGSQRVRHD